MKKIILLSSIVALSAVAYIGCQKDVANTKTDSIAIEEFAATTAPLPYATDACETNCIDPAAPVYFEQTGTINGSIGNPQAGNNKQLTYKIWNDLTNLYVDVYYDRTNGADPTCVKVTVGVSTQYASIVDNTTHSFTFPLPSGWVACQALSWAITESAANTGCGTTGFAGQSPLATTGTYNLIGECDNGCDESFTYVDNGGGSYTFTYIPSEDLTDALLVFTFGQGTVVSGGIDGTWSTNGQTRQKTMSLEECEVYTWTVTLSANCSGGSGNSNVWTDFKVNGVSKKASPTDKFVQVCP